MKLPILALSVLFVFVLPLGANAQTGTSIRVISPNGGETFATTEKGKLTIEWEALNVPQGGKLCIGDLPQSGFGLSLFADCFAVKNGKGKMSVKISNEIPHHLKPGKHSIQARIDVVKPVLTKTYQGTSIWLDTATTLATDTSDGTFTILPVKKSDKKAGVLEIYEDGRKWEESEPEELVFKDVALRSCTNVMGANEGHKFRCVWRGKEIGSNIPSKKNKLPVRTHFTVSATTKEKVATEKEANALCVKYAKGQPILPYSCSWGGKYLDPSSTDSLDTKKTSTKKKTSSTSTKTDSAEADAADAIADAAQEIEEVQEEAERAQDQAIGLAVLAMARSYLEDAEAYFAEGNWSAAKSSARRAEDEAYKAGSYF